MLEIEHISVHFAAGHTVQAVEDVSFRIPQGSRMAIVGETGSGKSVLLLAILNLLPKNAHVSGKAVLDGEDLLTMSKKQLNRIRGGKISYVPQGGGASLNPLYTIGFQVGEPLMIHRNYSRKQAFLESISLLKRFNLGNEEKTASFYPHMLSGGMRQRAMVAMGISAGAEIIFADEPTKGLDERRVHLTAETLNRLEKETLLCVTHDLRFASEVCQEIIVMYAGQQVEAGQTRELFQSPLHPYTKAMLEAMPENGMKFQAGFAAEHSVLDGGCRYRERCPYAQERCRQIPPMAVVGKRKVRSWNYVVGDKGTF